MKKITLSICFAACLSTCFAQAKDPVIVTIGGEDIPKSEFEYIWNKNKSNEAKDSKSLDKYVDLFVNFKLKVAEAKAQKLDTTKSYLSELKTYRHQLEVPYMTDKAFDEIMSKEIYDRMREYVETSHILVAIKSGASPEDTLKAYTKAMDVYNLALKGEDFAQLAKANTDDRNKEEGGYLGFSTGGRYVYPFENTVFSTPVGSVSKPFRTQFGYHVVKVHSRKPAWGMYRSGHIMKLAPLSAPDSVRQAAKDSIFKMYEALRNGGDFQEYATKHSDDRAAAAHKGEYDLRACGTLPYEYEDALYKVKAGQYSEPFQSKYGWHIVKALEFKPYPEMDQMRDEINKTLNNKERSQIRKEHFVEKLKTEYHFTETSGSLDAFSQAIAAIRNSKDTTLFRSLCESEAPMFVLDGVTYTQKQFASTFSKRKNLVNFNIDEAYAAYVQQSVLGYEESLLEKKYPEFANLMKEYSDGILLFEVSNREVWEKASLDTAGLKSYFAAHKSTYKWDKPHYKGFIIQCKNDSIAKLAKIMIKDMPADSVRTVLKRAFNRDSTTMVKVDWGLYACGENAHVDRILFKHCKVESKTDAKAAAKQGPNSNFPAVFLSGRKLGKKPQSYGDVRGLVISDYQNLLEKKWTEALREKYPVVINKAVVNTVNKD